MGDVWLGVDLGTSSVKSLALDAHGRVLAVAQRHYPVDRPHAGWAEQDPELWWTAAADSIAEVLAGLDAPVSIRGVGLSGQMHGVVLVDRAHRPVRPAIIWSDGRGETEAARWRDRLGDERIERITGFRSASGMAGISLSWLRAHEPDVLDRAAFALQPKDFIRLRLTGHAALDPTDAGASLLFDLDAQAPSAALLETAGIDPALLPALTPTLASAGTVTADAAARTGLPAGLVVAAGGGDQAMAALALGLRGPGRAAVSLSSGGTVVVPVQPGARVPSGAHRLAGSDPSEPLAMGVVLAAGLATEWLATLTGRPAADLLEEAGGVPMDDALMALADLGGTRTPHADSRAQGAFAALGFHHTPAHLMRALVEGAAVSLTDSLTRIQAGATGAAEIVLSGGGARFPVWRQAVADAAGMPVLISSDLEHSALGAALAAAEASGTAIDFDARSRVRDVVEPDPASVSRLNAVRERRTALTAASIGAVHPPREGEPE